jgi:hypothetical protein
MQFCDGGNEDSCKVRGITLNYKASQLVNFETIKDLVLNGRSNSTVTVHTDRKSDEREWTVLVYR